MHIPSPRAHGERSRSPMAWTVSRIVAGMTVYAVGAGAIAVVAGDVAAAVPLPAGTRSAVSALATALVVIVAGLLATDLLTRGEPALRGRARSAAAERDADTAPDPHP